MKQERILRGIGVSPGVTHGQVLKLHSHNRFAFKVFVDDVHLEGEVARLEEAIRQSGEQLQTLKSQLAQKVGQEHSFILEAHRLMLEDRTLISEIISTICASHANAEWAVLQATERLRKAVASLEDEYLRERASDIENVAERILANLSGGEQIQWSRLPHDVILISHDFSPSSFGTMDLERVRGLALESGGRTSHTAIISRSLRIPAVMGVSDLLGNVASGDHVILDGDNGQLILNPSVERMTSIGSRMAEFEELGKRDFPIPRGTNHSDDGKRVVLRANTDLPHEVIAAKRCGAEGIGLFRTDLYLFALPACPPDVESQAATYATLAQEMCPYPVAVRTRDTGMEVRRGASGANRDNANMGLRGIRLSLLERDHFCTQIEAILKAGESGNLEIVLPMVTSLEEVRCAKSMIEKVRRKMFQDAAQATRRIPIGAMIEVPAAVIALDALAREVDFLCVGTNDLIQYLLAVDRGNPQVSHLFQPLHPAVLHSLKRIAAVADAQGIPARVCGEMSANPFFAVLLLGLGFTEFSMNAFAIPTIRSVLHDISPQSGREIADRALSLSEAREIGDFLLESVSHALHADLSGYAREVLAATHNSSDGRDQAFPRNPS